MAEEKIVRKLVELESEVRVMSENMATRDDLSRLENRVMDALDRQTVILTRLDQERVFTDGRIGRIEEDVENLKLRLKTA